MRKAIFLTIFSFITSIAFSQLDSPKRTSSGGVFSSNSLNTSSEFSTSTPSLSKKNNGLMRSHSDKTSLEPQEEKLDITKDEGFIDPEQKFEARYLQNTGNERKMSEQFMRNESLGEVMSNGKFVKIVCRDHQAVDGDMVRIYVNGEVQVDQIYLEAAFKEVYIKLEKGFNKIEIEALNQGSSGPNTAAFKVYDDQHHVISMNEWNLATGYKASLMVVKNED
ncbi:hypothetical protein [Mesonia maritima]|uniref:Secreted protein n=1 Tax=Mesonia maritima TaxID=1793873 RepID=A0ABU1K9Z2_9FLAO|nr:hypothetical protein [Mesonia maritima]MDR6302106.1 hypothetical protein [Mesonia maritima]